MSTSKINVLLTKTELRELKELLAASDARSRSAFLGMLISAEHARRAHTHVDTRMPYETGDSLRARQGEEKEL